MLKLAIEQGMSVTEAARKLSPSLKTHSRWVYVTRGGALLSMATRRVQPLTALRFWAKTRQAGAGHRTRGARHPQKVCAESKISSDQLARRMAELAKQFR